MNAVENDNNGIMTISAGTKSCCSDICFAIRDDKFSAEREREREREREVLVVCAAGIVQKNPRQ